MATEWGDDDDFYGATCEMDDQMLIVSDDDDNDECKKDIYEEELRAKEAEYFIGEKLNDCLSLRYRYLSHTTRKNSDTLYPPERKPPIFDFFTVLTAFIVAVILAYYTISTY